MTFRLLLLIGFFLVSGGAAALSDSYDCEVKQIIKLGDNGNLRDVTSDSPEASLYNSLLGKTFVVNRQTGGIHGDKWFDTSDFEKVTIVSDGREENAFRVVYIGGPPTSVMTFLYVKETAKSERKPFIMVDSSFVELTFSGTCK